MAFKYLAHLCDVRMLAKTSRFVPRSFVNQLSYTFFLEAAPRPQQRKKRLLLMESIRARSFLLSLSRFKFISHFGGRRNCEHWDIMRFVSAARTRENAMKPDQLLEKESFCQINVSLLSSCNQS